MPDGISTAATDEWAAMSQATHERPTMRVIVPRLKKLLSS
jgi:hypothetical protein